MTDTNQMNRAGMTMGSLLALGLIVGGWMLGTEIKATRLSDRYVSVRGLAERTVKSDLAIWPIDYKEAESHSAFALQQDRKRPESDPAIS